MSGVIKKMEKPPAIDLWYNSIELDNRKF